MSIYISDVSLPPEGGKRLVLFIGPDGVVDVYRSVVEATPHLESIVCETDAIELPPHGRLGDLDALTKFIIEQEQSEYNKQHAPLSWAGAMRCFEEMVNDTHTIIPASK